MLVHYDNSWFHLQKLSKLQVLAILLERRNSYPSKHSLYTSIENRFQGGHFALLLFNVY